MLNNAKYTLRKPIALLLTILLLLPLAQIPAAAATAALRVGLIGDPHFYPDEMTGELCEDFMAYNDYKGRATELSESLFNAALARMKQHAKQGELDYLLFPGDLTLDGEYDGHVRTVQLLKKFEAETGVPVVVVPGNHDVLKGNSADFTSGKREKARNLTPEEFLEFYATLGYDLPGLEHFADTLSYAADLGRGYRLIAMDTDRHRLGGAGRCSPEELRDWVVEQCEKAKAAGKTVVGLGHHNLAEQIGGQEWFMRNMAFEDVRGFAGAFADAGMHFYFSGHLHLGEIAMQVSDRGEPLYDITSAAPASFPGDVRVVKLSASGGRVEADVRSYPVPFDYPAPYPQPYYATLFGRTFGGRDGGGMAGNIKARARREVADMLNGLKIPGRLQTPVIAAVNRLIDKAFALSVSQLPCERFYKEYGFGDPDKPGTVEDVGNSAMVYMFGKNHDPAADPFMQDVLRRIKNGEFVDQVLAFALPALLDALSGGALTALANHPIITCALNGLMALAVSPAKRATLSASLYRFASGVVASQSPTGNRDGVLVYSGPVEVPTGPGTFRLPQDLNVCVKGLKRAEITWLTRPSACTPEIIITDKDGNPVPEVQISISSQPGEITADQLDIGFTKLLGRTQPVLRHTARLTGLKPGRTYRFTAGDSEWGWYSQPRSFTQALLKNEGN